ncbi:Eco57I restriction-modification methylase domain-containing protein [Gelidibacter gilvus]|uniref:site-specific DNA-methyltransferase (adenine-specific) n=1 Tax=Gelidibacter gilvus TaxID=59602 RepID=A0A4Q0XFW2_9FLAO|nr:N-6 DNA methylase [Gelidibacter gilvus]RXJ49583.1 restriction endonuclease subunit M [Gelidibacter gilvus]
MALFQASVLKSHLALLDEAVVDKAYKKYQKYFWNTTIQENIKSAKEEQYQATFLNELFVNILGYTLFPNPNSNLTTEFKNEKNQRKADGAILKDGVAIGVIELKGTNTKDLESIRRQAFDYKANHKDCVYVITSNFEKLRFYINDATEFEEFDLFTLSPEHFKLLFLCLHINNILNQTPLKIKEASVRVEEEITKAFYKDYSIFKRELFRDLVKRNAKTVKAKLSETNLLENHEYIVRLEKNVKLTLFQKSQKLIDRFLFVFFAEDRMLLPYNSTLQILKKWKDDWDFGDERPLYDLFKQYFHFLDSGRKGTQSRAEIYAYNGGLFKPDAILDALEIDNDLLYKYTSLLSNYDFESQIDVNILGHIFENSLNEIESVNSEIEGGNFDKQTSKRKKDGVFYTPKYITKYIVENTIGKLCEEKKIELDFHEEEYFKGRKNRNKATIEKLVKILDDYRDWLLQLTICDPACGSGAFLNQALDFLIKEHTYIDELKTRILGGGLQFPDIENTILENNIYGVDLNEESIEIAKLSLWLRTAQPRRKLNDLSSNIKCGNSLIDDKKVAGSKAFKWENEFPDIFENGGFDVIIGNPPYVRQELLNPKDKQWLSEKYSVGNGTADLYVYFYEKSIELLLKNGILGFITPNKFYKTKYGSGLRSYLKKAQIIEFIDFFELKVFDDVSTDSQIAIVRKTEPKEYIVYKPINNIDEFKTDSASELKVSMDRLNESAYVFIDMNINNVIEKIIKNSVTLKHYTQNGIEYGIKTGYNKAFILSEDEAKILLEKDEISKEILKPYIQPTEINRWNVNFNNDFLIATTPSRHIDIDQYPAVKAHMEGYGVKRLEQSGESGSRKKTRNEWFETSDTVSYVKKFDENKIIYIRTAVNHNFYYDEQGYYVNDSCYIISPADKFLSAFLNSSVFTFYKKLFFVAYGNADSSGRVKLDYNKMINVPVPIISEAHKIIFNNLVDQLKFKAKELNLNVSNILVYIKKTYFIEKYSRKLQNWQDLDFGEFIKELNKAIKTNNKLRAIDNLELIPEMSKKDEFEWMELFEENKKKVQELQTQITQTENEIDQMVYELYGLNEEEIGIVENS